MDTHTLEILRAMERYGGSFVKKLAEAAYLADPDNLARLEAAFPDLWEKYAQTARLHALRDPRLSPFPHAGGCPQCYEQDLCNSCGLSVNDRCTNGRCRPCCRAYCSRGGRTSSGHGFGKHGADVTHYAEV